MSIQRGWEDLQPKAVVSIDSDGTAACIGTDGKPHSVQLFVSASGALFGRNVELPIDQEGRQPVRRWAGLDQQ